MTAPDFALPDAHRGDNDEPLKLSELTKKSPVLLVFHRGFNCSKCFRLLTWIADQKDEFQKAQVQVLAISPWSVAETRNAIDWYGDFPFPLLSDPEGTTAETYGLLDADGYPMYGVFLVDRQQNLVFAERTPEPFSDMELLLEAAHKLSAGADKD